MTDNRNLLLALVLSAAVLFGWQYLVGVPQIQTEHARQTEIAQEKKATASTVNAAAGKEKMHLPLPQALKLAGARVNVDTPTVDGSSVLPARVSTICSCAPITRPGSFLKLPGPLRYRLPPQAAVD